MKKGLKLLFLFLITVLSVHADDEALVIKKKNGTEISFPLTTQPVITFDGLVMRVKSNTKDVSFDFSDLEKYNFQERPVEGDANADGQVNVTDIVATVNKIMGNDDPLFNMAAADVNGDGEINVTDIVMMVSIIMNSNSRIDNEEYKASLKRILGNVTIYQK